MEIYFNSKSGDEYKYLSNFYGDVEICFMQKRFKHPKMKMLFDNFKTCGNEEFLMYLKLLQPDKKDWTRSQEQYWFDNQRPIRGILAKLVGAIVTNKSSKSFQRRAREISKYLKISFDDVMESDKITTDKDMLECLNEKYSKPEFRDLLLKTGNAILHEKPLRGFPNDWTFKDGEGGDKLGKMLMGIREGLSYF